ncbi:MAG TPA: 5-oxoprolinase subunit PxpB [Candidatus Angelobacter sp.]|nr:5-oxoprolinase subunit PxpB [Candidatus Angelobacter sp.]
MRRNLKVVDILPFGDQAISIRFGTTQSVQLHHVIQTFMVNLEQRPFDWMIEAVPAFTMVTVTYDPFFIHSKVKSTHSPYEIVKSEIESRLKEIEWADVAQIESRTVHIPVCYGGEWGPDLGHVASVNGLSPEEVIRIHSEAVYLVHMIGFAPGFPYLGGLSKEISTPRRDSPRLVIPKGSVGIAGDQTGVYPLETPGGWQLIGRTPIDLFNSHSESPSLLKAGDHVRFVPITASEFKSKLTALK